MIRNLIFDLGMNNGDDTDFYLKKGFKVVAVEANPSLCALGEQRFAAELRERKLCIVNKAISANGGMVELFVNDNVSGWTTANPSWMKHRADAGTTGRRLSVQGVTLKELAEEHGVPYYAKIDVQGMELAALESLLQTSGRPQFLSISTGLEVAGAQARAQIERTVTILSALGYSKFKVVQQDAIELQRCPSPAREGNEIDHVFAPGSSGLFGHELPGPWLTSKQLAQEYRRIARAYKFAGNSPWPWPHAWLKILPSRRIRYYLDRLFWRGNGWYDTHAMHDASHQ